MIELCDQVRRGNILMAKPTKGLAPCYLEVTGIDMFSVTCAETEPPYPISEDPYNKICPVLLTEEILTKVCGFVKDYSSENYSPPGDDFSLFTYIEKDPHNKYWNLQYDIEMCIASVLYLHELQNIYQELISKKLKIKFSSL